MTIVVLTDCPPKLRGDLTKWLLEINTGVYVGNINARVRDELWNRICENIKNGRATMVYKANNEQKMDFRIHNTTWEPIDYDGIKLIRRPIRDNKTLAKENSDRIQGHSNASRVQKAKQIQKAMLKKGTFVKDYCVLDIETTGLDYVKDEIIEIGILKIRDDKIVDTLEVLIQVQRSVPEEIERLTGLTNEILSKQGISLEKAMIQVKTFIGDDVLVLHNASFDMQFLLKSLKKYQIELIRNQTIDTLSLARRKIDDVENYKLITLAQYFKIADEQKHRAIWDCKLIYGIYINLNKI